MPRKYLAFDLETAKDVPGDDLNWRLHRPLGITCAAALASDAQEPRIWHGKNADGTPTTRLSKAEASKIVLDLLEFVSQSYTILTWNGVGFDFDVLAEESAKLAECRELARAHVDMMFYVLCDRGFPVGIDSAAKALRISGKPPGMSGKLAPQLWAQRKHREVLDYVTQDVRMTLQVALKCEAQRRFVWITKKGVRSSFNLDRGWLNVRDAFQLPEPDTSWMTSPLRRRDVARWLDE